MKLSILIATIQDRINEYNLLEKEFLSQIKELRLENEIELIYERDNRQMSIGRKRQVLLERAHGDYIVYFDDDDFPYKYYIKKIWDALQEDVDCIGLIIDMTKNGHGFWRCCHSLKYSEWAEKRDGYDYVRNVTHFNPVKRELALKIGFKDMRYAEDHVYSDALTKLCKTEKFINQPLFKYRYSTKIPHHIKYGI